MLKSLQLIWKKNIIEFFVQHSFPTLQQDLPDFLHHQQLCKQELICQEQDDGYQMLCCSSYSKHDTTINQNMISVYPQKETRNTNLEQNE